jgi:Helix-turn-helix domain
MNLPAGDDAPPGPVESPDDPRWARAIGHPLRARILAILDERTASAVEIARELRAELGVVAYHVRTLHRLELIELVRETPVRGAVQRHFRAVERAVPAPRPRSAAPAGKQSLVAATLDDIVGQARSSNSSGGFDRTEARLSRSRLRLDRQGWEQLADALRGVLREVEEIAGEAAARQASASGELEPGVLVLMQFQAAPVDATPDR